MKFNSKTRIKVSWRIQQELGTSKLSNYDFYYLMEDKYGLTFTSRRIVIYYFKIVDKQKFLLFSIEHPNFIIK